MEKMEGYIRAEFSGDMSWEDVPHQWKRIFGHLNKATVGRGISLKQESIQSYQDIMELYMAEMIEKAEGVRLDANLDVVPWV
jgi:hypothetical protein